MSDAATPVTQSAVEQFTYRYLSQCGCEIEDEGDRWMVECPEDVDLPVESTSLTLLCGTQTESDSSNAELLHAESKFFQQLVDAAVTQWPVGTMSISSEDTSLKIPDWIDQSELEVSDARFTPYYDRTALVVLFEIAVETVSEYQNEFLRAIAVDLQSHEVLHGLAGTFLENTASEHVSETTTSGQYSEDEQREALDIARDEVYDGIKPHIDEIHENATRSADAELEEYRRLQEQHLSEVGEKISSIKNQISELNSKIEAEDDQSARKEFLRERKELRNTLEELKQQQGELREKRDAGFPEKQREIRDRHAVKVKIRPVTLTRLAYEVGDLELGVSDSEAHESVTVRYASGEGVTGTIDCESCGEPFDSSRIPSIVKSGLICNNCID